MKVAFFNVEGGHAGGAGSIASDIAQTVNTTGGESLICYGRLGIEEKGLKIQRIDNKIDVYTHVLLTRVFDAHGYGSKKATYKAINALESFGPDLLNLHIIHGYYLNYDILFKYIKEKKIPVVWTFHDSWAYTGHCATYDQIGCDKWITGCNNCPKRSSYPQSWLLDHSSQNYQRKKNAFTSVENMTIVTPSQWLAEKVKKSFLKEYRIEVINNGIDLNVFHSKETSFKQQYGIYNKKMVLGVASTWSETKGLKDLVELSKMLSEEYVVVVIGVSEKQKNELPSNMIGIEKTTNREALIQAYAAADVFVDPTTSDNFPTVILEALACGTPVATYNTGGCPEEIDNTCGRVIEQGDIPGLCQSVIDLINMGDISNQCINRAQLFDKKDKCQEYMHLFNSMLSGN